MEDHQYINISMESINNIIFESIGHIQDQKKKKSRHADIYKIEGNKSRHI